MQNEISRDLANKKFYDFYMFFGDSFLVDFYTNEVLKAIDLSGDSTSKIYFDEYDFTYCKNRLLESSLFSPKNLLLIKTEKVIPKKELDELCAAANSNPDSFLVVSCYGDGDFKGMLANAKKLKNSSAHRFFTPNEYEALGILKKLASQSRLNCDQDTLSYLLNFHRNDLSLCSTDIEKLSILNEKITPQIIQNHCFSMTSVGFDDFFYALMMKQNISNDLASIMQSSDNLIFWISQLQSNLQQVLMINSHIKLTGNADIAEIIGFKPPPKIANQKMQIATKTKTATLISVLDYLQDVELNLKSSKIDDKDGYFYTSLSKISGLL